VIVDVVVVVVGDVNGDDRTETESETVQVGVSFLEGLSPDPPPRGMKPRGAPSHEPSLTAFAARRPVGRLAELAELLGAIATG